MKIKIKLSLIVICIMTVVITGISSILLLEASNISIKLSKKGISYLTGEEATYWKSRQDSRLLVLTTLANIMGEYNELEPGTRRDRFDSMLEGTIDSIPELISLYTVWKPGAIDGMDAEFTGRLGSTRTGQYTSEYSRETGALVKRASIDLDGSMAYLNALAGRKDRVEQPFVRNVNGKDAYVYRLMAPIICADTGRVVGGVGCVLATSQIQQMVLEKIKNYDEISAMSIYSSNGHIIASYQPDRIGKKLLDVDTIYGSNIDYASHAVLAGIDYQCSSYSGVLNSNVEIDMQSFKIGNSDMTWTVMIAATENYILADVYVMIKFTILIAVIAILASAAIIYFVLNFTTKPIVTVSETLRDISEGEGDLTRSITVNSNDEIGDLAKYFNNTIDKIRDLVISIKIQADSLSEHGNDLASNMTETAAAINQITANIQSIKTRFINQSASVTQTKATMEQLTSNISRLDGHVESQSANVAQASSAIEEMIANTRSVTDTLIRNSGNVKNLMDNSEVGRTGLEDVSSAIQGIARESEGLIEINSVIENIASQTNLLSMNAAIEAAHAGDAGRGFAVVADEIRKLAENSGEQSKTISMVLKKIKDSIDNITVSTENVLKKFQAIDSSVKTVSEQEESIRNAMEEQGSGSKQILDGIGNVNEITRQVKNGSAQMLEGSNEVIRESKNLEAITQEISGGMNEMASGAEQINVAVTHVNALSGKTREGIGALLREVSRFKVV